MPTPFPITPAIHAWPDSLSFDLHLLTCLGVGDGWPSPDRRHSSFLYQFNGVRLLVDCGDGACGAFKARNADFKQLDQIFLSHLHADHIGGLPMFVQGLWLEKRRRPLRLNVPREGLRPLRGLLDGAYLFPELVGFPLHLESLHVGQPVKVGNVRVTPHPTRHLESIRQKYQRRYRRPFESFSFVLEGAGRRVAHTADIGHVDDLAPLLAKPLDLLVCELAHCEAADILDALRGKPIRQIVFIHLARAHWADRPGIRRLARSRLGGIPFMIATDGCEIRF